MVISYIRSFPKANQQLNQSEGLAIVYDFLSDIPYKLSYYLRGDSPMDVSPGLKRERNWVFPNSPVNYSYFIDDQFLYSENITQPGASSFTLSEPGLHSELITDKSGCHQEHILGELSPCDIPLTVSEDITSILFACDVSTFGVEGGCKANPTRIDISNYSEGL